MTQDEAFAEIINLRNVAIYHKAVCDNPNCGVSIHLLRQTATRLLRTIKMFSDDDEQINQAKEYIKDWPI